MADGPAGFPQGSSCPAVLRIPARDMILACKGLSPAVAQLSSTVPVHIIPALQVLQPRPRLNATGLGSSPFARHYSGNRSFFLFLGVLRCFSSPRLPQLSLVCSLQLHGLPHSDISGSRPVCGSPELFAAYRVLHRHRKPRHPPFALLLFLCK